MTARIVHQHTNIAGAGYLGTPEMRAEVWRLNGLTDERGELLTKAEIAKLVQHMVPEGERRVVSAEDVADMLRAGNDERQRRLGLARAI